MNIDLLSLLVLAEDEHLLFVTSSDRRRRMYREATKKDAASTPNSCAQKALILIPMQLNKSYTVDEAKARLERYCAYQERCHQEIRQKLKEMRMIPEAVDHIINHLLQQNYLNETRFAQAFARGKFRTKHWGRLRITLELKRRDISAINIKIALKEITETDYQSSFHRLAEKRWAQLISEENPQRKKKKFADYLIYRGWESSLIWEKFKDLTAS